MTSIDRKSRRASATDHLTEIVSRKLIGQTSAISGILPYIQMHQAGLSPEGRPAGVFLLLGPSGSGKTKTVEVIAEALHGSDKNVLRIDCGEFQMEHEVAKLIGAPPGYLGHRETHPLLSQAKLNAATSERSNLAVVLFDEVEKAASSLARLLLGVLDKAVLRLGDNTTVNFERTLIFMTSNLGAREMLDSITPGFGFASMAGGGDSSKRKLESIGMAAVRKRFAPEFVNRLDAILTYEPLTKEQLCRILDLQIEEIQRHIDRRLGARAFSLAVSKAAREFLLRKGTSPEFGARELKRTLHRQLMQPLAALVAAGRVPPQAAVRADAPHSGEFVSFRISRPSRTQLRLAS
ncbi:MAG TPA: AAA family ATPase [Bryobacteraceae bacterium]|nr:AAA family ATPase [Bryobacteraceae bacterium]